MYSTVQVADRGRYSGLMKKLSDVVRDARNARGLTQDELGEAIDKSFGYIGMVETDKIARPKPDTLRRLTEALQVPLDELVRSTGQLDPIPPEEAAASIQRIAALPTADERLDAWQALPADLRKAVLVLMQDVFRAGADQLMG